MNVTYDLGLSSIAIPLIGAGSLEYPLMDIMKALMDACSFYRRYDNQLKRVIMIVHHDDPVSQVV